MDTQHKEFRIGVMVLAAIVSLIFLTVYFGKQSIVRFGDEYTIKVRFERTPGINKNSPVFKNGVRIGRVAHVELVDEDREVEISILLPKERNIYTDEECRVRQTVITGDASLEFVKKTNFIGKVELVGPDSSPMVGGTPTDLVSGLGRMEGDLTKAINNVSQVALQVGDFVERASLVIGSSEEIKTRQAKLEGVVDDMTLTMKSVRDLSDGASKFINDPAIQADIKAAIKAMPETIDRARVVLGDAGLFFKDGRALMDRSMLSIEKFDRGVDRLEQGIGKMEEVMDSVMKVTDQAGKDFPEFMDSLKKGAAKLESFLDELTTIAQAASNADGTLKRLMQDPELYEKILASVDNVQHLTAELERMLRTDVKPITNNVKILTDKAARDPSIFIKNMIRKEPPTKGHRPIWGDGLGSDSLGDLSCNYHVPSRNTLSPSYEGPKELEWEPSPDASPRTMPTLAPTQDSSNRLKIPFLSPTSDGRAPSNKKMSSLFTWRLPSWRPKGPTDSDDSLEKSGYNQSGFNLIADTSPVQTPTLTPPPRIASQDWADRAEPLSAGRTKQEIPDEGVVVQVDPRYQTTAPNQTVYQLMSHTE